LGVLTRFIPPGVVDEVVAATDRVQQRTRLIPARMAMWFVLGLSLYVHR
jgi:hypothetical protein